MAGRKVSPKQIIRELTAIAFARVPDCMVIEDGDVRLKEGLKPLQRASIASIEKTSSGVKVKFYDKLKALELLGKQVGLFEGKGSKEQTDNNLLEAIVAATAQEVDIHDIPELQ